MTRALATILTVLGALFGAPARAQDPPTPARREEDPTTGPLSEDEFKALHELRRDGQPVLRGEDLLLGRDKAYLALPPGGQRGGPAVVVIHEWWGLNEHVKHWTDRLAAEGYFAVAVDLYGGQVATTPDAAMALMKAVDPAEALRRLQAAVAFLRTDPRILASKVGSIGWCFGGGQSLALALADPDLAACVVYYGGRPPAEAERLRAIRAKVIAVYGTRDRSIPPDAVDAFEKGLTDAGVTHEVHRFDADHAFANPSNPRYQSEAAAEAWARVRAFLARHLRP